MSMLANLSSQKIVSQGDLEQVIFGLCRLNAWEIRDQVGDNRTVVFTLPGQSSTAELLPPLQAAFPCERHVFVYDGCIDSTARGLRFLRSSVTMDDKQKLPLSMPKKISVTTPITQLKTVPKISALLTPFSYSQAGIIEAWFSSVDAFLQLKHNEKKNGYTPFVCRLGFLLSQVGRLGNGSVDQSQLALTNVLQYMTGSRSRLLKSGVLEEARKILEKIRDKDEKEGEIYKGIVGESVKEAIEAFAFAHKGILIENKTLMDTVQPQLDWSLKAAKKLTSCACCMPGQGDEEEEEDEENDSEKINEKKSKSASQAPLYVDGKTTFAFDPTRFS